MEQFAHVAGEFGAEPSRVRRDTNPDMFEGVTGRIDEGLLVEGDAWIDPDQVVSLLTDANEILGVNVVHQTVLNVATTTQGSTATTESDTFCADLGIIATGANALPDGAADVGQHIVRPVHGITVRVRGIDRSTQPMIRSFVRGSTVYMVSRPGGYNVLGASSEERSEAGRKSASCSDYFAMLSTWCQPSKPRRSSRRGQAIGRPARTFGRSSRSSEGGAGPGRPVTSATASPWPPWRRSRPSGSWSTHDQSERCRPGTRSTNRSSELVARLAIEPRGIAVAIDGEIIRKPIGVRRQFATECDRNSDRRRRRLKRGGNPWRLMSYSKRSMNAFWTHCGRRQRAKVLPSSVKPARG